MSLPFANLPLLAQQSGESGYTLSPIEMALVIAAVAFLLFAFTRRGRTVASVMFGGLLFLLASGLFFSIFHLQPEPRSPNRSRLGPPTGEFVHKTVPGRTAAAARGIDLAPTTGKQPGWVGQEPGYRDGAYFTSVRSTFKTTENECRESLEEAALQETREYVDTLLDSGAARELVSPAVLGEHEIIRQVWTETREFREPTGTMYQMHAQLAFDDDIKHRFQGQWQEQVMDDRLTAAVGGVGLLLLLLGTLFGYLKIDTATRGYYSGRLKLAAATIIIGAAGAAVWGADRLNLFGI